MQRAAVPMAKACCRGRMRSAVGKGERRVCGVRGTQAQGPGSSAPGVTRTRLIPSALTCDKPGKCRLPGELVRDPVPGALSGAGHLGTLCLARTEVPGPQKGSRCSALTWQAPSRHLGSQPPSGPSCGSTSLHIW